MIQRLVLLISIICIPHIPLNGQGIKGWFSKLTTTADTLSQAPGSNTSGYIFSDGTEAMNEFDPGRTDVAYRLKHTPHRKLVQIFAPYTVDAICIPGDTLNPLYHKFVQESARYSDTIRNILIRQYSGKQSLRNTVPSIQEWASLAECAYQPFPLYARTFNMVHYSSEKDNEFRKFYHLVPGEYRYVMFLDSIPLAYAIYVPSRPELTGIAAIAPGDSVVLAQFPKRDKLVAVSPYMYRPGLNLPKNMGFGYADRDSFRLLHGRSGFLTVPLENGKLRRIAIEEGWEPVSPKVHIINALSYSYNSLPGVPEVSRLGP